MQIRIMLLKHVFQHAEFHFVFHSCVHTLSRAFTTSLHYKCIWAWASPETPCFPASSTCFSTTQLTVDRLECLKPLEVEALAVQRRQRDRRPSPSSSDARRGGDDGGGGGGEMTFPDEGFAGDP